MFKNIEIETPRLILRLFRPEDSESFHMILSQEEVMHYLPESVMTLDEVRKIVDWYQMCYEKNTPENIIKWTLAVWLKADQFAQPQFSKKPPQSPLSGGGKKAAPQKPDAVLELIGWAGVGPLEFDESQTEIFYGLASEYWGKGYATEAAQAVLEYAFDVIGLKRIVGVANPDNVASVKILEKIGMGFEKKLVGLDEKFQNDEGSSFYSILNPN